MSGDADDEPILLDSPRAPAATRARCFGATDVGRVREHNEDAFVVGDLERAERQGSDVLEVGGARGALLVVCDGMGGAEGGEVAADLAARTVWSEMRDAQTTDSPEVFARLLRRALRAANRRVFDEGRRLGMRGMGTTVSAAGVNHGHLIVGQIGDSRAYVLRADVLVQVTRDQSLISALLAAGHPTDAGTNPSAILQALGVGPDVEPSLSIIDLRAGDRILLCSDGLHGQLGEAAIATMVAEAPGPDAAARLLIDTACAAGGHDNITALVAFVDGSALAAPASVDDLPRFREFDPREEGERAFTSTSNVARRLAARIGIGEDPGPPVVPATGQFPLMATRPPRPRRTDTSAPDPGPDLPGPARQRLPAARPWWWWWMWAVVVAVAAWLLAGLV
ncbi:MAG: serine/threonine-protein phosphatase [Kofleriaceae bacterium]|jgi:serine/threonine protein phosphatase PrpC|nr:serine/threonine-protein phosphatase [Kofleriaceae bacterium]MBP6835962.1 serine/threonine-protein phosphatase [Kofleriaceae bacterium]MBP9208207.1 serine/threonine-protein phosphatase [Kofleriaceae bacterium]